jgi:glycosyltransferase involved in cell wall biosynthesis
VQALRGCIDELLTHPARAAEMGRRGRALVETELSPGRHYAALMQVYERAIARHRPPSAGEDFKKGSEAR